MTTAETIRSQLVSFEQCAGKTIRAIVQADFQPAILIAYTDGTYSIVRAVGHYDGDPELDLKSDLYSDFTAEQLAVLAPQARAVARPATMRETIQAQLAMEFATITVKHAGGTVTLTPDQARKVLAGGELTVVLGKVMVK